MKVIELFGCLSLTERGPRIGKPGMAPLPISLMCLLGIVLLHIVSGRSANLSYRQLARPRIVRGHELYWASAGTKWSNCRVDLVLDK